MLRCRALSVKERHYFYSSWTGSGVHRTNTNGSSGATILTSTHRSSLSPPCLCGPPAPKPLALSLFARPTKFKQIQQINKNNNIILGHRYDRILQNMPITGQTARSPHSPIS